MSSTRPVRPVVVTAAVALVFGATGCSDDPEEPSDVTSPAATESAEPTGESSEADDVAAIERLYADYWDAVIASENGPDSDPALFDGIATGAALETQLTNVRSLESDGLRRIGAPTLGEPVITVDGDTATVEVCVDSSTWGAAVGDVTAPPETPAPRPSAVTAERVDGDWLITEQLPSEKAGITC